MEKKIKTTEVSKKNKSDRTKLLTVKITPEVHRAIRIKAAQDGVTINEVVNALLAQVK